VTTIDLMWLMGRLSPDQVSAHMTLVPFVVLVAAFASLTKAPRLHGQSMLEHAVFAMRYGAILLTGMLAVAYVGRLEYVNRESVVATALLVTLALFVNRGFLRWWYFHGRREHPSNYLKVLVIGSGRRAQNLIDTYRRQSEWGVDIIGMLDPEAASRPQEVNGLPVLGGLGEIRRVLATQVVDEVVVCVPRSLLNDIEEIIDACGEQAICVKFLADVYDLPEGATLHLDNIGNQPVLSVDPVYHEEGRLIVKRIMDLLMTIPVLVALTPLFALVALAIKLDSRGPVFFKQDRVGLNKRPFQMLKFRSMYQDAEARLAELEHLNEAEGPIFKIADDPRVTRVGRFIRRSSIDELPQLFNVLLGDMSLVGPRPMSLRDVSQFSLGVQRRRFSVRPGLACLREVSGRSRLSFDRWLELDLQYIEQWSLWLDLKILLKLVPSVIKGDGAS
jgi:exopolysaccharide biosynthesis polyprenyl glycosylphosphotransferase